MKKAFTLIELIIVISIIALLSTLGMSTYNSVQEDTRNAKRKSDLKELKAALESYKLEHNNRYPSTSGLWSGLCNVNIWGPGGEDGLTDIGTTGYIADLAPLYIDKLPRDPRENKANLSSEYSSCEDNANYNCYLYKSDGANFKLLAHCTPEGKMSGSDPFYDPCRPIHAWQVSSDPSVKGTTGVACNGSTTGW